MSKERLKDEETRKAIGTRLEENFLVEAGAGSGKTTCLVDRMAALLAGGYCDPERLAAVTFTRKAAGELKEKFQVRLEEMYREERDPRVKRRLEEGLARMERAFVGTIHSFCARLLRERPLEAGIAPDFTEIEGLEERLLEERAWEDYLLKVRFEEKELLEELRELDLSPEEVKEAFRKLNRYPDVDMVNQQAPYPDLTPVRKGLEEFCRLSRKLLPPQQHPKGWDDLQKVARRPLRWQKVFDLDQDRYLLRLLEKMDKNAGPTLYKWGSKEEARELQAFFQDFRENQVKPALKAWLKYRHAHLLNFLLPATRQYQERRRRENKLNFQDLLMITAKLLKNNPEVRDYFQNRYTHLLVDEFQDTDPIQAEIMLYLTGEDLRQGDWTRLVPRPGSLFVVGDPKQSIYRFRRADIDTYIRVKEIMEKTGGEVLYLTSNFRSLSDIIDWTNQVFPELFSPLPAPFQAGFVPMDPVRKKEGDDPVGIYKMERESVKNNKNEDIAWQDACHIAAWISRSLQEGLLLPTPGEEEVKGKGAKPLPGDFLILVRFKKDMTFYARALEARGIPFSLSGGGDISQSSELKEILCLLQALADPHNPVPLVATLRGLFFGISDDHLYRFKMGGGSFSFLKPLPPDLEEEIREVFQPAWEKLQTFWKWTRQLPASSAVERIISHLGAVPLALAQEMGKGRTGYLLQALELLRQQERLGEGGFSQAVAFMEGLLEEGLEEELDIEGGGTSPVRIMNLHKAKGLQAPVVILANPSRNPSHDPDLHVIREAEEARGYVVIDKPDLYNRKILALPPEWDHYQEEERKYQLAEEVRLLYVAATRAQNLMVISTYPKKPDKSPWHPLEKYLEDIETIPPLKEPSPPAEEGAEPITLPLLEKARGEMEKTRKELVSPTYHHLRATEAVGEERAPRRKVRGKGAEWGIIIHAGLEFLIKNTPPGGEEKALMEENLQGLAEKLVGQQESSSWQVEEVLQALKDITRSSLWKRVWASRERYGEVPFGIWEGDTFINGTIDLAFREGEGWILVDYKTDVLEDDKHLEELVEYYAPQLEIYQKYWERITGEKVREGGFFFTHKGAYEKL
ncbi:MAG: hypothetical protein D5R97_08190 [Candidatus Syntrophonatronum acetioxidans]|uniref:DNA 3'-5' helicase n=1 Tax=Candidatus Syntrophonatronum acetioxidans TaxID=1795816 RepID=A0A424YCD1_9FIRM|nr:MAG: hypothetical protein D5R97_08190 [Candidatus Syntrophonatronum acetioxidans]